MKNTILIVCLIALCGCVTVSTDRKLDLTPDSLEATYTTDQDVNGTGYEFTATWNIK